MEKSRGCRGSFFVFSIFVFFWLSESLVLQIFLINWKQGKLIILRNFTEGNSRNLIRIFLYFHLKNNYVIRIGTRQDRYVSMREFSSDSTMAVSSKYIQDLSVQIVFFTFSFKWFLCFYLWAVIWAILVTCLLLWMSLRQLARAHY